MVFMQVQELQHVELGPLVDTGERSDAISRQVQFTQLAACEYCLTHPAQQILRKERNLQRPACGELLNILQRELAQVKGKGLVRLRLRAPRDNRPRVQLRCRRSAHAEQNAPAHKFNEDRYGFTVLRSAVATRVQSYMSASYWSGSRAAAHFGQRALALARRALAMQ